MSPPPHTHTSGSSVKPVGEEAAETVTTSACTKPQTEGHQASAGEPSGLISLGGETQPDGPAPAASAALQEGQHSANAAVTSPSHAEEEQCPPTNGLSGGPTEPGVLCPSSLSDSDLMDDTSSLEPEKPTPREPADVNLDHTEKTTEPDRDMKVTRGCVGQTSPDTPDRIVPDAPGADEVDGSKPSDAKSDEKTLSESIQGCDVPDGLGAEAVSPSLPPEPKKQSSLFKRNKKKSNPGKLSNKLNKGHVWNASLLICRKGRSIFLLFLLHFAFYILCMGYFST